jgi:cyanophycinase
MRRTAVRLGILALGLLSALGGASGAAWARGGGVEYYVVGNAEDVAVETRGGLMLMGGGTDVDAAFQWMIDRARGGDFVVIRASGADAYNPYIYDLGPLDSVETVIIKTKRGAYSRLAIQKIRQAEALFIAGGDQADYVEKWKGTPIEDAIHAHVAKGAPLGGTSAGLAVMGEFSFAALNGTVTSSEALADPYHKRVTLERDFLSLPFLEATITDSHLVERDRMGRDLAFLARIVQDGWAAEARGIAIDRETAVLVDSEGGATLVGNVPESAAYFLRTPGPPEVCAPDTPLTFRGVQVYRARPGDRFDLPAWRGTGGTAYTLSAEAGALSSTQDGGDIY